MSTSAARRCAMIADADGWRASAPAAHHREWQHFVLSAPGWLLAFNLCVEPDGTGRIITLHDAGSGGWRGHVATCAAPRLVPTRIDGDFGCAGMRFRTDRYELWQHGEGVRFEASLTPASTPSLSHHIAFGHGALVSWCLVPRLFASGWLDLGGQRVHFDRVAAYHDHNWGSVGWGGDFSWDWGVAIPDDPDSSWTVVFTRMMDRARHRTTATSLFLLEDGDHVRYLRNEQVRFEADGVFSPPAAVRVPPAAALLAPDRDRDVPRRLAFTGARGDDHISGEVEPTSRAQILIPADSDICRVIRMNECAARARITGRHAGRSVGFEGRALLETVRG